MDKKIVWESNLGFNPVFVNQIIRVDNNGFCEYEFSGSQGSLFAIPSEAKEIADAIYTELGLGWLPYPENKPEEAKDYFVYTVNIKKTGQVFYAQWSATKDAWLSPFGGLIEDEYCKVIAYMEIPTYQPEDSHES